VLTAARLGRRCRARLTVLTVVDARASESESARAKEWLDALVVSALSELAEPPAVEPAVVLGLPGIEIGRFAETHPADLIVLGRKRRSALQRLLMGDTADAVARRSRTPCLFVSDADQKFDRFLVALDGTERGLTVLLAALDFVRSAGARVAVVSVEQPLEDTHKVPDLLTGRSASLVAAVCELARTTDLAPGGWDLGRNGRARDPVVILRGNVVDQILGEVESSSSDILVVGYHRGGPAGVIDAGSVGRRLAHEARKGVLTIPL
jgi:nucleotide-binding universal stress UspA family protein